MTAVVFMLFTCLGAIAGFVHLKLLSWNVRALAGRLRGFWAAAAPPLRAIPTTATFVFVALHGMPALIGALGGFLLSRALLVRRPELLLS